MIIATFGIAIGGAVQEARTFFGGSEQTPMQPKNAQPSVSPAPKSLSTDVLAASGGDNSKKTSVAAKSAMPLLRVKRVLKIDGPFRHGEYVWDDEGVPPGPVVITIDLKAQTLSVFRDGYEIGAAVILYGATDKPSPIGSFPVLEKDADHLSNLYDNAPMPYALRLTQDGVFIHGSDVVWGNATHGCIGVPIAFAKKLFDVAKLGDPVIITDGQMLDVSGAEVG
jgi:hypothetical protein